MSQLAEKVLRKKWAHAFEDMPSFVSKIHTIDREYCIDPLIRTMKIERLIVRKGYHRLQYPEDTHLLTLVVESFSHFFWLALLLEKPSVQTLAVCARYFKSFKIRPRDLLRYYLKAISSGVQTSKAVLARIAILDRYRIFDVNSLFIDTIASDMQPQNGQSLHQDLHQTSVVCLPYVAFLATERLQTPVEERLFKTFIRSMVIEFGADPSLSTHTGEDPMNILPTHASRQRLKIMREIHKIHTLENFIDREVQMGDPEYHQLVKEIEARAASPITWIAGPSVA